DQRLPRAQFDRWQAQVQKALAVLEEKRLAEPAHEIEIAANMTEETQSWHGPELG
ncbi:MAG: hypothetical protein GY942_09040, partial [Aestuariibacter sp.]|nr:hypothetical protein [Aestuariibacter sp.]